MIKCDTCEFRHDIYCKHPKAKKFMFCGYSEVPYDCPIKQYEEYSPCENCPRLQAYDDDIC